MGDLIFVLSIFAVGVGCGYYLRDLISKKRHERYLASKQSKRSRNTIGSYLRHARPRPRTVEVSDASADSIAGFTGAELDGIGDATSPPSRHDQI
jgi:ribosomal protein S17E